MTNLEWIQTQATEQELAVLLDSIACTHCGYSNVCNMATLHYNQTDCNEGIILWLKQERKNA